MGWAHTAGKAVGLAAMIAAAFVAPSLAAQASEPDVRIDGAGVTLSPGDVFTDGSTIAVSTSQGTFGYTFTLSCLDSQVGDCEGVSHSLASFIGESFLPWSALGLTGDFCVTWVNLSLYDEAIFTGTTDPRCTGATGGGGVEPTGGVLAEGGVSDGEPPSDAPAAVAARGDATYTG